MTSTSICQTCSGAFKPTPGAKGLYCSPVCSHQGASQRNKAKCAPEVSDRRNSYAENPNTCAQCSSPLEYKKRKNKFCSSSCAATFNNTGRSRTEESKQNTSRTIKRLIDTGDIRKPVKKFGEDHPRWSGGKVKSRKYLTCYRCDQPFDGKQKKYCTSCKSTKRTYVPKPKKIVDPHKCLMCDNMVHTKDKTCSPECRKERHRQAAADHLRKNRHKYVGPHQRSYMERTFVEWLESHGITKGIYGYWDQVHFTHKPDGKTKNGWADFVFVSRRLIIELDGSHHKSRTHLDEVRDAHLSDRRGYKVIRIAHAEYTKKTRLRDIHEALGICV